MSRQFNVNTVAVRDLGLRDATDRAIFDAARKADVTVMTKDSDFLRLLDRYGSPPRILWITCGNTSNAHLQAALLKTLPQAISHLEGGEALVEISGPW